MRALVTGASSGIGLAVARRLAAGGAAVLAVGRSAARLEGAFSGVAGVRACALDVCDADALGAAVDGAAFDVVVASAGICRQARLDDHDAVEVWTDTLSTNLDGVFHTLRFTTPQMPEGGAVVVVSSGLGSRARPAYGAYCASKHAVEGLVKCAALELAPRVRVNAVSPGWVDTPMSRADIEATARRGDMRAETLRSEISAGLPLGRPVNADEVANLVLFLASPAAAAITGQSYRISCGELIG